MAFSQIRHCWGEPGGGSTRIFGYHTTSCDLVPRSWARSLLIGSAAVRVHEDSSLFRKTRRTRNIIRRPCQEHFVQSASFVTHFNTSHAELPPFLEFKYFHLIVESRTIPSSQVNLLGQGRLAMQQSEAATNGLVA